MNPELWRRVDEVLQAALEAPEEERAAAVRERCGDDAEVRRQVERLLAAHEEARDFLETPPLGRLEAVLAEAEPDALSADREPAAEDLPPGSRIGRYVVRHKIGEGGMGRVYAAWDPELDRPVAVKLVHLDESSGQAHQRLLREAQALARVSHPNVVTIHDTGAYGNGIFLAMEHVEGGTLEDWLASDDHPWQEILDAFLAAARGLAAAHATGIVHRDFKPANVLRDQDGRLRVADFGLARAASDDLMDTEGADDGSAAAAPRPLSGPLASNLTGAHRLLGTPSYMAPEQHQGAAIGPATDQFAFCIALYQALYREHPFGGDSAAETRARMLAGQVSPTPSGPGVPAWLHSVILKGLAVDPERRWGSMAKLIRVLERGSGRRRRLRRALGVVTAAVLGALLVAAFLTLRPASPPSSAPVRLSVAVLPFDTIGQDPEDRYLSEGITDGLISSLKGVEALRVPDRASVYALREQDLSLAETARRLEVELLLQGTVDPGEGRLRVTARLIDARDGEEVWSGSFDRPPEEMFAIQEQLARGVVDQMEIEARDGEISFERPTESLEAYSLYLKGRDHWNQRTAEGLRRAVDYFERALAEDDHYALAYAGLADAYSLMPTYDPGLDVDALDKARAAARRALELDPDSAQAHASLAMVLMRSGELDAALEELERAVDLDPRYATARHWYGVLLLRYLHRPRAAVVQLELARRQDPVSSSILAMLAGAYYQAGLHQQALEAELKLQVLDPQWRSGNTCIARNYLALRQWQEAIAAVAALEAPVRESPACQGLLAQAHHFAGEYAAELDVARRSLAAAPGDVHLLEAEGGALAALGRVEEARDWVGRVLARSSPADLSRYALYNVMGELRVHGYPEVARETAGKLIAWHRQHFSDDAITQDLTVALAQAVALIEGDRPQEAAALLGEALDASSRPARRAIGWSDYQTVGMEGWLAALAGRREEAWSYLRALEGLEASSVYPPYGAIILAALGEREEAYQALRERFAEGLVLHREVHVHPGLAPLLDGPASHLLLPASGPTDPEAGTESLRSPGFSGSTLNGRALHHEGQRRHQNGPRRHLRQPTVVEVHEGLAVEEQRLGSRRLLAHDGLQFN